MKKSLVSVILVFVMLFTLSVPAFAAVEGGLTAKVNTSADGKTATVTLSVNNNSGFIALQVQAKYDSKALKLKSAENGKVFDSIFSASQNLTDNPYQIIFMDAFAEKDIKTNGVLATYTFEVLKSGETEIIFSVVDAANLKGETENKFNTCTVKVGGKEGADNPDTPTSNNGSGQAPDNNQTVLDGSNDGAQTPDSNQSGEENSFGDDVDLTLPEDQESNADQNENGDNIATTIIVIVAALVLVAAAVCGGIYIKKGVHKM